MPETAAVERLNGGMCIYTTRAFNKLAEGNIGDIITRAEMENIIGRECGPGSNGYGNVQTAIRAVENERGIVWRWRKEIAAYKCLSHAERVSESTHEIARGTRKIRRSLRVSASVDIAAIDEDTRRQHTLNCAIGGAMRVLGHGSTRKKLESAEISEPDVGRVLKLMQK